MLREVIGLAHTDLLSLFCVMEGSSVGHVETKPADTPEHLTYEQETTAAQARWLSLSSNSKQIFARHSSEYIQFDEPETVINAVRDIYDQARRPVATHGK